MGIYYEQMNVTPANGSVDISDVGQLQGIDYPILFWMRYWVETSVLLTGTFAVNLAYVDPKGRTRTVSGTPIPLADLDMGFYQSPVYVIERQNDAADIDISTVLTGLALTSKVNWRACIMGGDSSWAAMYFP